MAHSSLSGTAQAWAALGGDPALLGRVRYEGTGGLPAALPVMELARSTVAVCALAAAELAARRTGGPVPSVRVDDGAVTAAFLSDRLVRVDGEAPTTFAPLSRFWRAADGWVRTHANYPHHRARLRSSLGLPDDAGVEDVAAVIGACRAAEVEERVYAAGGLAVAARGPKEWAAHEQGALAAAHPLLTMERLGQEHPPRVLPRPAGEPLLPCAGLRVLDLTRVLAGPVATRTLALLGADVLRIDAPQLPESQEAHNDTGMGKRSTRLDLGSGAGRAAFEELLAEADVVVTAYRPGALDRFGLTPEALAARRPGLVVARLSAWGRYGPWHQRRGFDSLVQVATGIAAVEGGAEQPGALPAQALDHGTGYLLAAGVLRALTGQHDEGGARLVQLALSQTAAWLVNGLGTADPAREAGAREAVAREAAQEAGAYDPEPWLIETDSPMGRLRHALPAVSFDGGPANWARPSGIWGTDTPVWA
ncbi:CoA transferase [Streptomyces sp. NBC_01142]|uniref:CoA transferase n=1 Tax=Streptomyces sp. NBC_01142 TaxID=2975865 RepID=UPI00225B2B44|nr:CoA transferase [Streptomyces sp. NBC_01142]MCX4822166.1 CoA transferase [Streptomyces sp. NBC_01142]